MRTDLGVAAGTGYIGWVAYPTDGSPIYEAVPHRPGLAALAPGIQKLRGDRPVGGRTMEWKDVPHGRLDVLELYFGRGVFRTQPVAQLVRANPTVRFFQFKEGALMVPTAGVRSRFKGQRRTDVSRWSVGYFDAQHGLSWLFRFEPYAARGPARIDIGPRGHPCWPEPHGFGLPPATMGLEPEAVPPCPYPSASDPHSIARVS